MTDGNDFKVGDLVRPAGGSLRDRQGAVAAVAPDARMKILSINADGFVRVGAGPDPKFYPYSGELEVDVAVEDLEGA